MNMDFKSAEELLNLCEENQLPISEVMRQRECLLGEVPRDSVNHRMGKAWEIMRSSATQPLKKPIKSMGGLIGGEAKKLEAHDAKNKSICGDVLEKSHYLCHGSTGSKRFHGPDRGRAYCRFCRCGARYDAGPAGVLPDL